MDENNQIKETANSPEELQKLKEQVANYQNLFNSLEEGFCIIQVLFDEKNKPIDYIFLEINKKFEEQTGLKDVIGKRMRDIAPEHEEYWFEVYGQVALTGNPVNFEYPAKQLKRYYNVRAIRFGKPEEHQVAVYFSDIQNQKNAEKELRKIEARYKDALDNMMEGIAIIDFNWVYLYVNDVNAKHAHLKVEEMIGRKIEDVIPGYEESDFHACYKEAMHTRTVQRIESNFKFADGTEQWFESIAHPIPEGIFVLSNDITSRKLIEINLQHALNEKEVLLKELYHRTKNNLQIISSLLNLKGSTIQDEDYRSSFMEMKNRIQAMGLVHERLYRTGSLSRIELSDYIKDLTNLLIVSHSKERENINIIYDLTEVEVTIDIAIPIGLILTELVLNVIKYAFPKDKAGTLEITLSNLEDGYLYLTISDDGIGIPPHELEQEEKLGLQLVKGLIESQLNGELNLDTSKGTSWGVKFRQFSNIKQL